MNASRTDTDALRVTNEMPSFPIVGIGASAGGLEAFTQLLTHLPATLNMAYVFIQHLDPTHQSLLTDLLGRATPMPVHEASDRMSVERNHVYVIPPNTDLTFTDNQLILVSQENPGRPHLSIDTFLRSLAESRQNQAIGIVLSGTASDGTLGLQAIKTQGGVTFAQEPASAKHAQMPQNAIAAGWVDRVGTPEEIALELSRLERSAFVRKIHVLEMREDDAGETRAFRLVLRLLAQRTNIDFTAYKSATLTRRMARRMVFQQQENLTAYLAYLRDHPQEVEALSLDLLIGVTGFFRDPATYQTLLIEALPHLIAAKSNGGSFRVWVPGCSTGEEVYSLAICLLDFLAEHQLDLSLQLFGTDLNASAITRARVGLYSPHETATLSPTHQERYFQAVNGYSQINKSVRDLCVFAQHNLLKDPPFSHLDLVSCRNVLIYLETEAQYKIAQLFYYALLPHGVLQLGPSESIRVASHLFAPLGERARSLYTKKASGVRLPFSVKVSQKEGAPQLSEEKEITMPQSEEMRKFDLQQEVDHLLLARYAPACVVINAQMDLLYVRGHTSPYLEVAPGRASLNLFKMVKEGLGLELRSAISKARKSGQPVKKTGIPLGEQGRLREISIEVIPVQAASTERSFVILFEEDAASVPAPASSELTHNGAHAGGTARGIKDRRIRQLEQELAATREEMRSVIEELEAANEELQSANEESLSSNEELQSLNEELETSKEEIQSSNEELLVVNQELMQRNTQVQAARAFAEAIVETIREPLLILESDLRVRQANKAFYQCFQIEPKEVEGYLFFTLGQGEWNIPALRTLLEEILPRERILTDYEVEQTFSRVGHKILLLNAQRIDGDPQILLAIEDITERRLAQQDEQKMHILQQREAFMAIASHELRTPVTSIKGYTQMLQRRFQAAGNEQAATLLARMDTQINKLVHLIEELLDTTRIEEGKLLWHHQFFDLQILIQDSIEDLEYTQQQHQIRIEGTVSRPVFGDPERIGQVLTNLLTNAMKYSPQATMVLVRLQADADKVTIGVQDFGMGIAPEKHPHIFERFFRLSDPEHATFPGLGLGLYISAEIVKAHGGKIWVESQPGAGATFFFTLPLTTLASANRSPEEGEEARG
ncbi:MAG TPA: chemotaxis protein CheB [Ktedonobacteraceae bacterium]